MRLPEMDLVSPATVADACRYLEEGPEAAQPIAGGTDLLAALKDGQKQPRTLVDLSRIGGLDAIAYDPRKGLELGATATLRSLAGNADVRRYYPVLAEAALAVASPQIQGMATVAGNLCQDSCCMYFNRPEETRRPLPPCHKLGGCVCHVVPTSPACWAPYAGDLAPVLMALGATVAIAGPDGEAVMPLGDLYTDDGARPLDLRPGQLITAVRCPPAVDGSGAAYIKLRPRQTLDYAVVGVAARLALTQGDGTCTGAAVALTGVASSPKQVEEAEELIGAPVTDDAIARIATAAIKLSYPVKNVVGTEPGYRRGMVKELVERGLREARRIASERVEVQS